MSRIFSRLHWPRFFHLGRKNQKEIWPNPGRNGAYVIRTEKFVQTSKLMKTQLTTLDDGSRTCEMSEPVSGRQPVLALLMRLLLAAVLVLPVFGAQAGVISTSICSSNGGNSIYGTVFSLSCPSLQLTIVPAGTIVNLTWPSGVAGLFYSGYTLQSSTDIGSSANWNTNSLTLVVIGGQNMIINPLNRTQVQKESHEPCN